MFDVLCYKVEEHSIQQWLQARDRIGFPFFETNQAASFHSNMSMLQASSIPTRRPPRADQGVVSSFLDPSPPPPPLSPPPPPPPPASPSPPTTSPPPPLPPPSTRRRRTAASSRSSPQTPIQALHPPTRCILDFLDFPSNLEIPNYIFTSTFLQVPLSPGRSPRPNLVSPRDYRLGPLPTYQNLRGSGPPSSVWATRAQ